MNKAYIFTGVAFFVVELIGVLIYFLSQFVSFPKVSASVPTIDLATVQLILLGIGFLTINILAALIFLNGAEQ